jgi:hypothetical protein
VVLKRLQQFVSTEFFHFNQTQFASFSCLAPMTAPVFLCEAAHFRFGAEHLTPLPVLENNLITARQDLKRPRYGLLMIERY